MQYPYKRRDAAFQAVPNGPDWDSCEGSIEGAEPANVYHEGALETYSAIVQYHSEPGVTDDNTAKLDAAVSIFRQESLTSAEYGRELGKKTLSLGSVYDEKSVQILFLEKAIHTTRKTTRHW